MIWLYLQLYSQIKPQNSGHRYNWLPGTTSTTYILATSNNKKRLWHWFFVRFSIFFIIFSHSFCLIYRFLLILIFKHTICRNGQFWEMNCCLNLLDCFVGGLSSGYWWRSLLFKNYPRDFLMKYWKIFV